MTPYHFLENRALRKANRSQLPHARVSRKQLELKSDKGYEHQPRGVALLIAVILSSVVLAVALALLDITYKQVLLSSSATESQYALYAADSTMECALYFDQQQDAFDYTNPLASGSITCNGLGVSNYTSALIPAGSPTERETSFQIACTGGGVLGQVTVYKTSAYATNIFATGYSSCNTADPRRIERGLEVHY